jgi:Cytochrome c554 and c-prime
MNGWGRELLLSFLLVAGATMSVSASAALVVPTDIQQPGTQPGEAGTLETPDKCDNCHGNYNRAVEPAFNWRGSMMANATRDPIFWATLAVAEQDVDGSGDLCLRCHSTSGWHAGRSTPTDGSALAAGDADGVDCDTCHKSTNPNNREHAGAQSSPFLANDEATPATGYYGTGMLSLWPGSAKLGPYVDAGARHQFMQSKFHRDVDFCGSCHDVSNPAVGDLAHNGGRQSTSDTIVRNGVPGTPVTGKAAFNNFPYKYGVVERTHSEFKAGTLSKTPVTNYASLPADLKNGAIKAAFDAAGGNYADGSVRYFSCQTCHMRAVTGYGANKAGIPLRTDLPLHDMTGGNYWAADAILYQNTAGTLRMGGGMTAVQTDALIAGKARAQQQLKLAATLSVANDTVRVVNLTGHKLITGYPEGRRMWLNVKWYDASNVLLREDGKYDVVTTVNGVPVKSLVDLNDSNTKVYEAHYGMTKEWADQLLALGYAPNLPLSFDRVTGLVDYTLHDLSQQPAGTTHETFHFVLNNMVVKDNRIPTYGMSYEEARKRNALPVPASQYGNPTGAAAYNYWDEVALNRPTGAAYAQIKLMYQPTSWEYVQFVYLANTRQNSFLANEGVNLLNAWLNTGMAEPYVIASAVLGTAPAAPCATPATPLSLKAVAGKKAITLSWTPGSPASATSGYRVYYSQAGKLQFRAGVGAATLTYKDSGLTSRMTYTYAVTAWNDCNGNGVFDAGVDAESAPSTLVSATAG